MIQRGVIKHHSPFFMRSAKKRLNNKGTSKNNYKDVPLWAQYIGKNRFLMILFLRLKAVLRGAHKWRHLKFTG